jgi:hypothetical protein
LERSKVVSSQLETLLSKGTLTLGDLGTLFVIRKDIRYNRSGVNNIKFIPSPKLVAFLQADSEKENDGKECSSRGARPDQSGI